MTCPRCRSDQVVPILYGYPLGKMVEAFERGEAEIGGCIVSGDDPRWLCKKCDFRWGKATSKNYSGAAFVSFGGREVDEADTKGGPSEEVNRF